VNSLSELKGGAILLELLQVIAGDVVALLPEARILGIKPKDFNSRDSKDGSNSPTGSKHSDESPRGSKSPRGRGRLRRVKDGTSAYQNENATEQILLDLVVNCGTRCTTFNILTKEALIEGQTDILAAFLAGLFLSRPCLPCRSKSTIHGHIEHISACVQEGANAQKPSIGKDARKEFGNLCSWLQEKHPSTKAAMNGVQTARDLHEAVERQLSTFQVDILAQRARGLPCKLAAEDDGQDAKKLQLLPPARLGPILMRESSGALKQISKLSDAMAQVEDVLRKHVGLFREMFRHYALRHTEYVSGDVTKSSHKVRMSRIGIGFEAKQATVAKLVAEGLSATHALDLQGLMQIYKDCRLHTPRFLPREIETIYHEVKVEAQELALAEEAKEREMQEAKQQEMDKVESNSRAAKAAAALRRTESKESIDKSKAQNMEGLGVEDFMHVVILMASRCQPDGPGGLPEKIVRLTEMHFWPFACRPIDSFFKQLSFDINVRVTLARFDKALRAVFTAYSIVCAADSKHMHLDKLEVPRESSLRLITVERFVALLEDACVLRGQLTSMVLHKLLQGVQNDDEDSSDSEEESFGSNSEEQLFSAVSDAEVDSNEQQEMPNADGKFSFPEFTDALIAVVLYLDPNPFEKFSSRFERFIRDRFLLNLRLHWLEVSESGGLGVVLDELLEGHGQELLKDRTELPGYERQGMYQKSKTKAG